jgi:hypothetical protein
MNVERKSEFLTLCDLAVAELSKKPSVWKEAYRTTVYPETHHVPFFEDSYAVRALLVAYDMTGKKKYLDASTRWADRIVALQQGMIPKGAYYVNYETGRAVGKDKGDWWAADSGSVAMAVLATAVRTHDKQQRERYLNSVRSFARLVIDNYVGKDGGITNGLYSEFTGEWWCSTAIFSDFMYLAYGETQDPEYLKVALGATDWLNRHDFNNPQPPAFEALNPGVVFYCFESYAAALPYLEPGSPRRKAAEAHITEALDWMAKNQQGRGAKNKLDYLGDATYMGGEPLYHVCDGQAVAAAPRSSRRSRPRAPIRVRSAVQGWETQCDADPGMGTHDLGNDVVRRETEPRHALSFVSGRSTPRGKPAHISDLFLIL